MNTGSEIVQGHGVCPAGKEAVPPLPSKFELSAEAQAAPKPEPGQFECPGGRLIFKPLATVMAQGTDGIWEQLEVSRWVDAGVIEAASAMVTGLETKVSAMPRPTAERNR